MRDCLIKKIESRENSYNIFMLQNYYKHEMNHCYKPITNFYNSIDFQYY